jgi:dienelactone hydrolase
LELARWISLNLPRFPNDIRHGKELLVRVETIEYQAGSVTAHSALIYDGGTRAKRPLLLVSPNWLGMRDESIQRVMRMAGSKYVALLVDMYGKGKTASDPTEISEFANDLRKDVLERRRRIVAALEALVTASRDRGTGDISRKAAVGFCFGGGTVLELARAGEDLNAVICVHGDLSTTKKAKPGDIKASIFVFHGAADPIVPKTARDAFEDEMMSASAKWQMLTFGRALHSFSEEETTVPGVSEFNPEVALQTYKMIDDYITGALTGLF